MNLAGPLLYRRGPPGAADHRLKTPGLLDESFEPTATQGLIACRPLIQNMIQSLSTRVEGMLEKRENILAAILLPAFKMDWVEDEIKRLQYRMMLKQEFQSVDIANDSNQAQSSGGSESKRSSFFKLNRPSSVKKFDVDIYLDAQIKDDFTEYIVSPKLTKLFVKYNTALSSSAPVQRLFSIGGQIFRPRSNRLGDANQKQ